MMSDVTLINIKEEILAENRELAHELRARLKAEGVFLMNLMSSPGSGKAASVDRRDLAVAFQPSRSRADCR